MVFYISVSEIATKSFAYRASQEALRLLIEVIRDIAIFTYNYNSM